MSDPIKITESLYPDQNEGGYQCYGCWAYVTEKNLGETWFEVLADLDPGNPEVGPDPDIQTVLLCPTCHARVEAGGPLEIPEEE